MPIVYFFNDLVICPKCQRETLGYVEEFSAKICCDHCDHAILDANDDDDIVIFHPDHLTVQ